MHTFTTTRTIEIRELHLLVTEEEAARLQRALRTVCDAAGQAAPVRDLSPLFTALTEFVGIVEGAAVVVDTTPRIAPPTAGEAQSAPPNEAAAPAVASWRCPICHRPYVNRHTHWSAKHRGITPPWKQDATVAATAESAAEVADGL